MVLGGLLIKYLDWGIRAGVDFDSYTVHLGKHLELQVIPPATVLPHFLDVVQKTIGVTYKRTEVVPLYKNVVADSLPNLEMVVFSPV